MSAEDIQALHARYEAAKAEQATTHAAYKAAEDAYIAANSRAHSAYLAEIAALLPQITPRNYKESP
jgi:hypothetical protein